MTIEKRAARVTLAVVGLAALVTACVPVTPPPPPPPPPPVLPSGCAPNAEPTAADPVDYVALVERAGDPRTDIVTFTASSDEQVEDKVAELEQQGDVVVVEPDQAVSVLVDSSNDPLFGQQYGLTNADFPEAWSAGYDGTGVMIAVIDTGVVASHEDLTGRVDTVNGVDLVIGSGNGTADGNGHGTHVAGIAFAADNTVGGLGGAPGATVLPIRVLNDSGSGSMSDVMDGIEHAISKGADVINLSLGGYNCDSALATKVDEAATAGIVVVAAAGNCGAGGGSCPAVNAPVYPGGVSDDADLLAVGSTNQSNQRSSFSNSNSYVDLGAAGSSIVSTYRPGPATYATLSGTSMATPTVAAAVAVILDACPTASMADIEQMLASTAIPVAGAGAGLIQVGDAITAGCLP